MAVLVTTAAENAYTPSDQEAVKGKKHRAVYYIATPTVYRVAAYRSDIGRELRAAARELGVDELRSGADQARAALVAGIEDAEVGIVEPAAMIAAVEEFAAAQESELGGGKGPTEEAAALIAELVAICEERYQPYRQVLRERRIAHGIPRVVACRWFVSGWSNVTSRYGDPLDYASGPDGVADELLDQLPPGHVVELYAEIDRLMRPTNGQAKN